MVVVIDLGWYCYCGVVCLNKELNLNLIWTLYMLRL